jgi:hypothetical protein
MPALPLTPLESLSEAVARAAGPAAPDPVRMMAARGLAPLGPNDLVTALYQLAQPWAEDADGLAGSARETAAGLPDGVLAGALAAPIDPRVLDFFARAARARSAVLQIILFNARTADETFAWLASVCGEPELGVIARNELRLLRHPAIIAALYLNRKTPMSVAARAVELAVRNQVTVEGIPGFESVRAALIEEPPSEADDAAFRSAAEDPDQLAAEPAEIDDEGELLEAAPSDDESERATRISQLSSVAKLRLAAVGTAFHRAVLIRDANRQVAMAAIQSPLVNENEVIRYASNRGLSEEVIRYIATNRQFVRLYQVKLSLVNNPKCPLQAGMGFLPHLQPRDLRALSRSRSVSSALAKAAKGLMEKRNK